MLDIERRPFSTSDAPIVRTAVTSSEVPCDWYCMCFGIECDDVGFDDELELTAASLALFVCLTLKLALESVFE